MTQAPATPELVERLHQAGSRLGPLTRYGEDAVWRPATRARDALIDAAAALEAQQARIAELEGLLDLHAAMQSEVERAQAAEEISQALADRYEKALRPFANLLPDSYAPQNTLEQSLQQWCSKARQALSSSQGRREGGEG